MGVAFVDTETTGLDPQTHEIWEVGLIVPDGPAAGDYLWQLPVCLGCADPIALRIGGFHERRWDPCLGVVSYETAAVIVDGRRLDATGDDEPGDSGQVVPESAMPWWAAHFVELTRDRSLIGAVPSFDERRLWDLLRDQKQTPMWHYQPVDIEVLAVGYLAGTAGPDSDDRADLLDEYPGLLDLPYASDQVSRALGIDPDSFDRHTALGDAKWVQAQWDQIR